MMKNWLLAASLILSFCLQAQTKRVLFVGNSYTYGNNLPNLLANVASSAGDTVFHDSSTPGGYTLQAHSTNATTLSKIQQGNWDFMVLQEQSQRPSFPTAQVQVEVFPYAKSLDSVFNANNCGETVFYMTWGRKNGDSFNCPVWPPVCTYMGMDSLLQLRYRQLADSNAAIVSPVGAVWRHIRQQYPAINLYQADESHPSLAGSYAAACSFYAVMFRKDPTLITFNSTLNANDAANIRMAAKQVVYDSLLKWRVGLEDLTANFSYLVNGLNVQFFNQSTNQLGQIWDFGGQTSTLPNPSFTFPDTGSYTVSLRVHDQCDTVTVNQNIQILVTSLVEEELLAKVQLYPNPAQSILKVDLAPASNYQLTVKDAQGKEMLHGIYDQSFSIPVDAWPSGFYFLEVRRNKAMVRKKFQIVH